MRQVWYGPWMMSDTVRRRPDGSLEIIGHRPVRWCYYNKPKVWVETGWK